MAKVKEDATAEQTAEDDNALPLTVPEDEPVPDPLPPEPEPEPEPPPAEIKAAQYDYDGVTVMLIIRKLDEPSDTTYALNATDPYGLSPWLREELQRMVTAGEIVILPAPEYVEDAQSPWHPDNAANSL
jgi:hypothetical protein